MSYIGIGESNKAKRGNAREAEEAEGRLLLQRRINRMTLSLLGSANLIRPLVGRTIEHGVSPSPPWAKGASVGKRLQGNRWVGRVKDRPGLGG